jgi:hypothetical protein
MSKFARFCRLNDGMRDVCFAETNHGLIECGTTLALRVRMQRKQAGKPSISSSSHLLIIIYIPRTCHARPCPAMSHSMHSTFVRSSTRPRQGQGGGGRSSVPKNGTWNTDRIVLTFDGANE